MDDLNSWSDAFRDIFGSVAAGYTQIEIAKANRDATRAQVYDQMTGQYYLPGQRYTVPQQQAGGMSSGTVLLIGAALVAVVLLVR